MGFSFLLLKELGLSLADNQKGQNCFQPVRNDEGW